MVVEASGSSLLGTPGSVGNDCWSHWCRVGVCGRTWPGAAGCLVAWDRTMARLGLDSAGSCHCQRHATTAHVGYRGVDDNIWWLARRRKWCVCAMVWRCGGCIVVALANDNSAGGRGLCVLVRVVVT